MKVKTNKFDKSKLKSVTGRIEVNEKICCDEMGNPILSYPVLYECSVEINDDWSCDWFGTKDKFCKINKE